MLLLFATDMRRYVDLASGIPAGRSSPNQQFCGRGYGNITYVGAHNSYAVGLNNRELCGTIPLLSVI